MFRPRRALGNGDVSGRLHECVVRPLSVLMQVFVGFALISVLWTSRRNHGVLCVEVEQTLFGSHL
jgi:hypothetical protein